VALLNGAEGHTLRLPRTASQAANDPGPGTDPGGDGGVDNEATAREAISHLAYNGLALRWDLPGEPSDEVRSLVASHFREDEIVETLSELACRYAMKRLADDHLGLSGIELSEEAPGETKTRPPRKR
jgi:hypothetical protein